MALGKMILRKQVPESYHSIAGAHFRKQQKAKQKEKKTPVYFRNQKRTSDISRLRKAGLTAKELRTLGYKGN
jgi:hypothetical protein